MTNMLYMNCPSCSAQNRASDKQCYNCSAPLDAPPAEASTPPLPSPPQMAINNARLAAASGGVQTSANMDRSSNWQQGLKAGLLVGLITGIFWGLYGALFGAALGGPKVAIAVFLALFGQELFFCALIGTLCGALDVLCYKSDCVKIGSVVGFVWAVRNFQIYQIVYGGVYGSAMALCCSHVEKRKRGQYSDL